MRFRIGWKKFARFAFRVRDEGDTVVPSFDAEHLSGEIRPDSKIRLTLCGAESVSLLAVQQIVDYIEYTLQLREEMAWAFVPVAGCSPDAVVAYIECE